jgi:transposase
MMRAYPRELRERIVGAVEAGEPPDEVAEQFAVSVATVYRYVAQWRQVGHLEPRLKPGRPRVIPSAAEGALSAQVAAAQDATLAEHCATWAAAGGQAVHPATMWRALARLGLTAKKRPCMPANKIR